MLYDDVTGDLNDFEVKEISKTINKLCRIICNNFKRERSVKMKYLYLLILNSPSTIPMGAKNLSQKLRALIESL